ncbi:M48 family peptidase [candidate division KSB1 bacterium]|nr:M48 family metallopeptidase [candidate division KSB1 bacterium]RQW05198.1 MAG: M48 family peptidase [candidate division KSB1 bacterium]
MKALPRNILFIAVFAFFIASCSTVPLTGRKQLNLIPSSEMMSMSYQQYDQFLSENKKSTNQEQVAMVQRCGARIQKAVEQYFAQNNMSDHLQGYQWEFNLVDDPQVNAWCMPGGKVVVYTGLLPVAQDETGLAVVMGHEIAHAVAEHGSERMSQQLVQQLGGTALAVAMKDKPQQTQVLWMGVYGVGTQYAAILPYSRLHESEADRLGLIFMAMAGYDPNAAIEFWQRMAAKKGGAEPPEILSTHPSDATRISKLQEHLPEAMRYYKAQ